MEVSDNWILVRQFVDVWILVILRLGDRIARRLGVGLPDVPGV